MWSLRANTGAVLWRYHAGGQVKRGMAYAAGRIFFGSYDHRVYSLNALTGRQVERVGPAAARLAGDLLLDAGRGLRPRVHRRHGRQGVLFGATSGKIRWTQDTGNYVYSSPAVYRRRVYVGSYSGTFYALDAATGDVVWSFDANGPISGSPTIIDGLVYFSTLEERTYALDARNGGRSGRSRTASTHRSSPTASGRS